LSAFLWLKNMCLYWRVCLYKGCASIRAFTVFYDTWMPIQIIDRCAISPHPVAVLQWIPQSNPHPRSGGASSRGRIAQPRREALKIVKNINESNVLRSTSFHSIVNKSNHVYCDSLYVHLRKLQIEPCMYEFSCGEWIDANSPCSRQQLLCASGKLAAWCESWTPSTDLCLVHDYVGYFFGSVRILHKQFQPISVEKFNGTHRDRNYQQMFVTL
jgi:hypothetical protein